MSGIILQRCVSMWGFVVVIVLTQQEANDREVRDLIKSHKTFFFFSFSGRIISRIISRLTPLMCILFCLISVTLLRISLALCKG